MLNIKLFRCSFFESVLFNIRGLMAGLLGRGRCCGNGCVGIFFNGLGKQS